jgi:hypothetical protein
VVSLGWMNGWNQSRGNFPPFPPIFESFLDIVFLVMVRIYKNIHL